VLPEQALDHHAHLGSSTLAQVPVDGGVLPNRMDQLLHDLFEGLVAEH
jgi:hypothetical protein